jgi:hypothetical protein
MDNLEEKLEKILDKKFKSFETVFDRKIDERFEKMEKSFDGKIDNLAISVQKEFSKIHEKLDEHTEQIKELDTKINTTKLELLDKLGSKEKLEDHELRIQNIEEKVFQA